MTDIAKMIDHTILKPDVKREEIEKLCQEAIDNNFAAVCINPTWIETASTFLYDSGVKVATVIGFPLGGNTTETKAFETKDAIKKGAEEIDMVINIGDVKDGNFDLVERDIRAVVEAADGFIVKVIIETSLLTDDEKVRSCKTAVKAGAHFVKTSTGFSGGGATVEDIKLMRETVGPDLGVKASGGIRDRETALEMIEAGATRIGASSGIAIVNGEKGQSNY